MRASNVQRPGSDQSLSKCLQFYKNLLCLILPQQDSCRRDGGFDQLSHLILLAINSVVLGEREGRHVSQLTEGEGCTMQETEALPSIFQKERGTREPRAWKLASMGFCLRFDEA